MPDPGDSEHYRRSCFVTRLRVRVADPDCSSPTVWESVRVESSRHLLGRYVEIDRIGIHSAAEHIDWN